MVAEMLLATMAFVFCCQDPGNTPASTAKTPPVPADIATAVEVLDLSNGCKVQGRVLRTDYGVESWRWALTDDVNFRLRVRVQHVAP